VRSYFALLLVGVGMWGPLWPIDTGITWEFSAQSGTLQIFQVYGLTFDLLALHAPEDPAPTTWAAIGVTFPDGEYLSLVEGFPHQAQVLALFTAPRRVTLRIPPSFATPTGVRWEACPFETSRYCRVARLVEATAPAYLDLPLQGPSNLFIHTGYAPPHPRYGFLVWPVHVYEPLPRFRPCAQETPCPR
jgi:hypothetical protein